MKWNYEDLIASCLGVVIVAGLFFIVNNRLSATSAVPSAPMLPPSERTTESSDDVETGQVTWIRDLDQAKQASAKTGKPIFCLFQEIPG